MAGIPEYLFDIIPQRNDLYNTHLNNSRTDILKYSFFLSTILEWNRIDRRIGHLQLCCLSEMLY